MAAHKRLAQGNWLVVHLNANAETLLKKVRVILDPIDLGKACLRDAMMREVTAIIDMVEEGLKFVKDGEILLKISNLTWESHHRTSTQSTGLIMTEIIVQRTVGGQVRIFKPVTEVILGKAIQELRKVGEDSSLGLP